MPRVYSHAFVTHGGPPANMSIPVPEGFTAVVKRVTAASGPVTDAGIYLGVSGVFVYQRSIPGAWSSFTEELRLVIEGPGHLNVATTGSDCRVHVAGYLFEDAGPSFAARHPDAARIAAIPDVYTPSS